MKDDLVEGQQVPRTDDLECQEMMAIQLDEARDFLTRETVAHARLAFILLDNAAEVIMRRNVDAAVSGNSFLERIRNRWKEILAEDPGNAEGRRQHDELDSEIVSSCARKVLADKFDAKADFIRERGGIRETEARVLKKLHKYRNELYHRDHIRPQTIRSACLLYFEMTCTLFEQLAQSQFSVVTVHMKAPAALRKFCPPGTDSYPRAEQIAASLRSGLGIDDEGLKKALAGHLTARLDDLEAAVSRVQDMLFGTLPELAPAAPWRQLVIHLAQWEGEELPESFNELLAAQTQYGEADLYSWRQRVSGVQEVTGKVDLFAAFADIEDAFEPFKELMMALDLRIDLEIQREVDLLRGK